MCAVWIVNEALDPDDIFDEASQNEQKVYTNCNEGSHFIFILDSDMWVELGCIVVLI